jgi:hypothetical protein
MFVGPWSQAASPLLLAGYLGETKLALGEEGLPDELLAAILRELEEFLDVFCQDRPIPVHGPGVGGGGDGQPMPSRQQQMEAKYTGSGNP